MSSVARRIARTRVTKSEARVLNGAVLHARRMQAVRAAQLLGEVKVAKTFKEVSHG